MKMMRWLLAVQVCLGLVSADGAEAQDIRRRTLLVVPNQPVEKAPKILIHKDIPTALIFEEAPKAVRLEGSEGRIRVDQEEKSIILFPKVELGNRERLILTVTAPDGARFVFGIEDGFNTEVDGQVIVRRGKVSLESDPAQCFMSFVLAQTREELMEVAYHRQEITRRKEILVEGVLTGFGFAIVLVDVPEGVPDDTRVRLYGEESGDLEIVGLQRDKRGLKLAVKRPSREVDAIYTLEVGDGESPPLVNREVTLWPVAAAQRTLKK